MKKLLTLMSFIGLISSSINNVVACGTSILDDNQNNPSDPDDSNPSDPDDSNPSDPDDSNPSDPDNLPDPSGKSVQQITNMLKTIFQDESQTPIINGWSGYDVEEWLNNNYLPNNITASVLNKDIYYANPFDNPVYGRLTFTLIDNDTGEQVTTNDLNFKTKASSNNVAGFDMNNRVNEYEIDLQRKKSGLIGSGLQVPAATPATSAYRSTVLTKTTTLDKTLATRELVNSVSNLGLPASDASIAKFNNFISDNTYWNDYNALASDLKNNKNSIDLDAFTSNLTDQTQQQQLQQVMLTLYNALYGLISNVDYAKTIVKGIEVTDNLDANCGTGSAACTLRPSGVITYIRIEYTPGSLNSGEDQYWIGQASSSSKYHAVVHEFGHAVDYFNQMTYEAREASVQGTLSTGGTNKSSDVTDALMTFIRNSITNKNEALTGPDSELNWLYGSMIVCSDYGLTSDGEFFAECFTKWLLTPDDLKNRAWEILNDFFINELPNLLSLNSYP